MYIYSKESLKIMTIVELIGYINNEINRKSSKYVKKTNKIENFLELFLFLIVKLARKEKSSAYSWLSEMEKSLSYLRYSYKNSIEMLTEGVGI